MNTKQAGIQVDLPDDRTVVVTREFRGPRGLVYDAFTRPELVQKWLLGPPGWSMPVCEMDVRVGGGFRWRWRSDEDGTEFGFEGDYLEVEAPARIRNTERFDPGTVGGTMGESIVTTEFVDRGGVTLVTIRMDYPSREVRDQALATGMTDGMEMSYQGLDELLRTRGQG